MNELRRKEIENLIERLEVIQGQIKQIRIADAISRTRRDAGLEQAYDGIGQTVRQLRQAIIEQGKLAA